MNIPAELPRLCVADDATFWAWRRWPEFSRWPDPAGTTVIVPLAGTVDWGLGHPLDLEEVVLLNVLKAASNICPASTRLLVAPPLRFVLGPAPECAFAVDSPVAHALVAEVVASIAASGFRRVVLLNASPWNEELIAAAARDLRIAHGLQIFRISLSGLGLDLHPVRSRDRRKVQTLVTYLLDQPPVPPPATTAPAQRTWGDESIQVLAEAPASVSSAAREGPGLLAASAGKLVSLLEEIAAHPPLNNGGTIPAARP